MLVLASKIAFIGWGVGIPGLDFTGISGHAMRAAAVLPVVAYLLLQQAGRRLCACGVAFGVAAAGLIGLSRLILHYHSVSEVIAGTALGMLVAVAFIWRSQSQPGLHLPRWVVGLSLLALVPSAYAEPAPTGAWVTTVALYLSGNDRPYVRKPDGKLARAPANLRQRQSTDMTMH
ncbi:MAG: phosphatase PAP2 family protein [Lacisediminimonas sp.]|nr:phosphatase PAP2 family protein [Lacisediminimonas sp.]